MNARTWILIVALTSFGTARGDDSAQVREIKPVREFASLATLMAPTFEAARAQGFDWLQGTGKTDVKTMKAFESLWNAKDNTPLLARVAGTLRLGDAEAAKLLDNAADADASAPLEVPALLMDARRPVFFRANLTLAYALALSTRRVYEEALSALHLVKAEQVVDPASYYFHRAVAEHALTKKAAAVQSITAIIEDVADAPDRYKMVALLMLFDMQTWKDKDLGSIARTMDNIERRLELARIGPGTQKMQNEVVNRLDELIKQYENEAKGNPNGGPSGGPSGGPPQPGGAGKPSGTPMQKSGIAGTSGPGKVDEIRLRMLGEQWGKLSDSERADALAGLTRGMPSEYRDVIERYFKDLARNSK